MESAPAEDAAEPALRARTDSTQRTEWFPARPRSRRCQLPRLSAPDQFGSFADTTAAPAASSPSAAVCSRADDGRISVGLQTQIPAHLDDDCPIDTLASERHPAHEGIVTNHIDCSRNPAGVLVNEGDGLTGKDTRSHAASSGKSARNIGSRILDVEGLELASKRHALFQLPKARIFESRSQLGLSGQNHGKELCGRRLDVREKTYLLEHLDAEALGLVYHERRDLPAFPPLAKNTFQTLEEKRLGPAQLRAKLELEGKQPDEIVCAKSGIIQVDASDVAAPLGFEGRA